MGAYYADKRFHTIAGIDPDVKKREAVCKEFNIRHQFSDLDDLRSINAAIDVVSICTPTETHFQTLRSALLLKPRLIFCEKPITGNPDQLLKIKKIADKEGVSVMVNYSRRWDPSFQEFSKNIDTGAYGELRSVNAIYNKGILNNGSHLIDLLTKLFGELELGYVGEPLIDYKRQDPTFPVFLYTESKASILFTPADSRDYSIFEITFFFSKAIISIEQGGLFWRKRYLDDNTLFNNYVGVDNGVISPGKYKESMKNAVENIYNHLANRQPMLCNIDDALKTAKVCDLILNRN